MTSHLAESASINVLSFWQLCQTTLILKSKDLNIGNLETCFTWIEEDLQASRLYLPEIGF